MNFRDPDGNSTDSTQLLEFLPYAKEFFSIALGLQWINFILIVSLNSAVIVTILRTHKKSNFYFLVMNMAIADLATGMTDSLVNAIERTMGFHYIEFWWFGDDAFCKFQRWVSNVCLCASNFILAVTGVDRALVLAKKSFRRGIIWQKALIVGCWCLSAALNSPLFFFTHRRVTESWFFTDRPKIPQCELTRAALEYWEEIVHLTILFDVWLPLMVIIASYTVLVYYIFKRAKSQPNSGMNKISLVFNRGLPSSKASSIKFTFGIVLSFILSWTPFMLMMYLGMYGTFHGPFRMILLTSYYWNGVANPIVFFVFHKRRGMTSRFVDDTSSNRTSISLDNRNTPERNVGDAEAAKAS